MLNCALRRLSAVLVLCFSYQPFFAFSNSQFDGQAIAPAPLPVLYFWTRDRTVPRGTRLDFSWSSKGVSSCRAAGAWSGAQPLNGGFRSDPVQRNEQFRLTCSGPGGSVTKTINIAVVGAAAEPASTATPTPTPAATPTTTTGSSAQSSGSGPRPRLYFWTRDRTVPRGTRLNFSWSSEHTTSCRAAGAWSGAQPLNGGFRSDPVQRNQQFRLTCNGPGGSVTKIIDITVAGATTDVADSPSQDTSTPSASTPIQSPDVEPDVEPDVALSFSVDNSWVARGGAARLSWSSRGAERCVASGDWSGTRSLSGSLRLSSLTEDQTFTLTCTAGSVREVATVGVSIRQVMISWEAPRENTDGSRLTDLAGFRLYLGNRSGSYQRTLDFAATQNEARIDLAPGAHYFALTALNADGIESEFSSEISKFVR